MPSYRIIEARTTAATAATATTSIASIPIDKTLHGALDPVVDTGNTSVYTSIVGSSTSVAKGHDPDLDGFTTGVEFENGTPRVTLTRILSTLGKAGTEMNILIDSGVLGLTVLWREGGHRDLLQLVALRATLTGSTPTNHSQHLIVLRLVFVLIELDHIVVNRLIQLQQEEIIFGGSK